MGKYIGLDQVKIRLLGKVRFTDDVEAEGEEGKMPVILAMRLINEAEGQVEFDLSPRYEAPFVREDGAGAFERLPDRPTKEILKTLCELKSIIRILEEDFGRGGPVDGSKYADAQSKRYAKLMDQQLEKRADSKQWKYPPLPDLKLAYFNAAGDIGFSGQVIKTDGVVNHGDFATSQINSPGENFFNASFDDINEEGTQ